jgi:hypothetical protein
LGAALAFADLRFLSSCTTFVMAADFVVRTESKISEAKSVGQSFFMNLTIMAAYFSLNFD